MNLYWVDGLLAQIVAVPLVDYLVRPQNYTVVLDEDLEQPSSLVLLPHRGYDWLNTPGQEFPKIIFQNTIIQFCL